jgi:hypothetical protein
MVVPGEVVFDEYAEIAHYCRPFHNHKAVYRVMQGNPIGDRAMSTRREGFVKRNEFGFIQIGRKTVLVEPVGDELEPFRCLAGCGVMGGCRGYDCSIINICVESAEGPCSIDKLEER